MPNMAGVRYFIVVTPHKQLRQAYFSKEKPLHEVENILRQTLDDTVGRGFSVVDVPLNRVRSMLGQRPYPRPDPRQPNFRQQIRLAATERLGDNRINQFDTAIRLGIVVTFQDHTEATRAIAVLRQAFAAEVESGIDLPIAAADHWCADEASQPLFGDRAAATKLIRANNEPGQGAEKPLVVNIVMVDQGVKLERVPARVEFWGGWAVDSREPGLATGTHGSMVMGSAIAAAARIRLYDFPLLPDAIGDLQTFLSTAWVQYELVLNAVQTLRSTEDAEIGSNQAAEHLQASWVLVNAWGVLNRKDDPPGVNNYGNNPNHFLNKQIARANNLNIDVVFAAGNCGQFCPSTRCGENDRGPGQSINGANSHPDVLSVGAVRSDGIWMGYSSQGPGQPQLSLDKPDVCAPSQFGELGDFSRTSANTGTSAACGMAAGIVAAIRNRKTPDGLSPTGLRAVLRKTARKSADGPNASERFGHGIIDAKRALESLP